MLCPEHTQKLIAEAYEATTPDLEHEIDPMVVMLSELVDRCIEEGDRAGVWANVNALSDVEHHGGLTPIVESQYTGWLTGLRGEVTS